ncbi:MAG: hypothetical protein ABFD51_13115 [Anaerolineaceae bacterium]
MAGRYDGSIRIDTSVDSKGFNAGIKGITNSLKGMATAAFGAVLGIGAMVSFGKSAIDTASQMASALIGLQSVLDGQGKSFVSAQKFIDDYIQDGLIPATNAITAYKNLSLRGYDTTQIEKTMIALKDSAAFGRQASYTMGEAVQSASEGLKNENSILVDNAGVTKNVSQMWKDYAASIGTTAANLTKQQKIQAEVNGILEESKFQTGDAAKLTGTYAGQVGALSASFERFKNAIGTGLMAALMGILPLLNTIMNFLVRVATTFSQLMQLLFGFSIPIKSTTDNIVSSAGAVGDLADNTEKAGKAARGALASFDELNVLQQDTGTGAGAGVGVGTIGAGAGINLEEESYKFKGWISQAIDWVKQAWRDITDWSANTLNKIGEFFSKTWRDITDWVKRTTENTGNFIFQVIDWIRQTTENTGNWIRTNVIDPVANWFKQALENITDWATETWYMIKEIWGTLPTWFLEKVINPITNWFSAAWENIKKFASNAWQGIVDIWTTASDWFNTTVIDPIRNAFDTMLNGSDGKGGLKGMWETTFTGIKDFIKKTINGIIDLINGMISAVARGLNAVIGGINGLKINIPDWIPEIGGNSWGMNIPLVTAPQIPHLATGAVIPAHANMLAMIGEGSQREIVAPEDMMRRIVREEMGSIKTEVTINFAGNLAALVRELKPYIDNENVRIGNSLILGAT